MCHIMCVVRSWRQKKSKVWMYVRSFRDRLRSREMGSQFTQRPHWTEVVFLRALGGLDQRRGDQSGTSVVCSQRYLVVNSRKTCSKKMCFTKSSNELQGIISTFFIFYTSEANWFLEFLFVYSDYDFFFFFFYKKLNSKCTFLFCS